MTDHGYEVFDDPYCYRGTFVLKNRANLREADRLEAFELEMSALRADEPLPADDLDRRTIARSTGTYSAMFIDGQDDIERFGRRKAETSFAIPNISKRK